MQTFQVLHVAIGYAGKQVDVTKIQEQFGNASWARYAPNCWLIHTHESPSDIANRVRTACSTNDSIFVAAVDLASHYGWLQKEIWDWINARR